MEAIYLIKAIQKLRPGSEFSFEESDYSTIKWDVLEGDAPTKKEVDAAILEIKAQEIEEAKTRATRKAALLDKLGITEEEAKLLLSNG
jgi:hypothetical protein